MLEGCSSPVWLTSFCVIIKASVTSARVHPYVLQGARILSLS